MYPTVGQGGQAHACGERSARQPSHHRLRHVQVPCCRARHGRQLPEGLRRPRHSLPLRQGRYLILGMVVETK